MDSGQREHCEQRQGGRTWRVLRTHPSLIGLYPQGPPLGSVRGRLCSLCLHSTFFPKASLLGRGHVQPTADVFCRLAFCNSLLRNFAPGSRDLGAGTRLHSPLYPLADIVPSTAPGWCSGIPRKTLKAAEFSLHPAGSNEPSNALRFFQRYHEQQDLVPSQ